MTQIIIVTLAGFLAGIIFTLSLLSWIGKRQANRAAEIIDKKIQDAAEQFSNN